MSMARVETKVRCSYKKGYSWRNKARTAKSKRRTMNKTENRRGARRVVEIESYREPNLDTNVSSFKTDKGLSQRRSQTPRG
jgi:hypothetical protein